MANLDLFFVLGAHDPEMQAIEAILKGWGVPYAYALKGGKRVAPADAYLADATSIERPRNARPIWVECLPREVFEVKEQARQRTGFFADPRCAFGTNNVQPGELMYAPDHFGDSALIAFRLTEEECAKVSDCSFGLTDWPDEFVSARNGWGIMDDSENIIDHHGTDPRASYGPDRYWEASSLGRVVDLLNRFGREVEITDVLRYEAANDHCKWAAALGQCPGVDAEAFKVWAATRYAEFNGWDPAAFEQQVQEAQCLIRDAEAVSYLPGSVADLSSAPLPEMADPNGPFIQGFHYATHIACLREGRACLVSALNKQSGKRGLQLNGAGAGTPAGEEPVVTFLAYAKAQDWSAYGDPARGYAGTWF